MATTVTARMTNIDAAFSGDQVASPGIDMPAIPRISALRTIRYAQHPPSTAASTTPYHYRSLRCVSGRYSPGYGRNARGGLLRPSLQSETLATLCAHSPDDVSRAVL